MRNTNEVVSRNAFADQKRRDLAAITFDTLAACVSEIPVGREAHPHAQRALEAFRSKRFGDAEISFDKARLTLIEGVENLEIYAALSAFQAYSLWFCEGVPLHERVNAAQYLYEAAFEIWFNLGQYENIAVHQRALAAMFFIYNRVRRTKHYFGASLTQADSRKVVLEAKAYAEGGDGYQHCVDLPRV